MNLLENQPRREKNSRTDYRTNEQQQEVAQPKRTEEVGHSVDAWKSTGILAGALRLHCAQSHCAASIIATTRQKSPAKFCARKSDQVRSGGGALATTDKHGAKKGSAPENNVKPALHCDPPGSQSGTGIKHKIITARVTAASATRVASSGRSS